MAESIEFHLFSPGVWRATHQRLAVRIAMMGDGRFCVQICDGAWFTHEVAWTTLDKAKEWCLAFLMEQPK
jgi:hypothetical protein